jgi:cAMP phosphodiesterase
MKVTLVPSAVSAGPGGRATFLTSYVVNGTLAIDAGALGLLGDLSAQFQVKDILLTHSHMDHIASLPIFLETVFQTPGGCVTLHASQATLDCLRRDIFNDRVWPDFIGMSEKGLPFVRVSVLEPHRAVEIAGLRVIPIPVDHVVPTLGFLIEGPEATVAVPSDTGPTEEFWEAGRNAANLKAVFLEASFPDKMESLAVISKHLTPAMFTAEARKLGREVPFIAVHIKSRFFDEVVAELQAIGGIQVMVGEPGRTYEFGAKR